jgi:SAM-dependent methyltransferase
MNIKEYQDRSKFAHEMLDRYFDLAPNNVISDIGAGFGHMEKKIISLGGVWQPFDYYKKMDKSIIWDLNNPYPIDTKKAGCVIFLEVLEHLANPLLGIQNIANHIESGGYLILTTPNPQSARNRINLLFKGVLYAFQEKHIIEHHVFTPWEHIVRFYLEQSGFEILDFGVVDIQDRATKSKNFKEFLLRMMERFIERRSPKAAGNSYGIVAKRK